MSKTIYLCAINNVLSGACNEDCKFCTQSVRYGAAIDRYTFKPVRTVVEEARRAKANGAIGYCLVTAGKGLDDKKTDYIARAAEAVKREVPDLLLIACNGTASLEQLRYLKRHGIGSYNHNLETSEAYYPSICSTHGWQERYRTCEAVKEAGLMLCTGGIFGMGESANDRTALIDAVVSLDPESTPLNFYHPNPALPLKERTIDKEEALELIRTVRNKLGENRLVMVAGGRELLFSGSEAEMFEAGANAIVIGDYLTTPGEAPDKDRRMLQQLGYKVATGCDFG
jgi:biotin synthase